MAPRGGGPGTRPHFHDMILFEGRGDLHRRFAPHIREAVKSGKACSVITAQPTADGRFVSSIVGAWNRGRRPKVSIHDAKSLIVGNKDPLTAFSELWDEMETEYKRATEGWTNIGCFIDEFYDDIGIAIKIERSLNRRRPRADILCYYSDEGFSSLEPKDILELFELHDSVRFPGAVFSAKRNGRRPHA